MRGWNDLPPETKQRVVQKLDFMSRLALRSTCSRDRAIVDATELYVPRVRIAANNSANQCLLVIYTGVEQFLRLEFIDQKDRSVKVYRSENTLDRRAISAKTFRNTNGLEELCRIITHNFIDNKLSIIGTMELEHVHFPYFVFALAAVSKHCNSGNQVRDVVAVCQMRVRHLVFHQTKRRQLLRTLFDKNFLESQVTEEMYIDEEGTEPETFLQHYLQVENQSVPIIHREMRSKFTNRPFYMFIAQIDKDAALSTIRAKDYKFQFENPAEKINEEVSMKRRVVNTFGLSLEMESKCGVWRHMLRPVHEKKFSEMFKKETCGAGDNCKTHADPFDYWYATQTARRMITEPKWCHVIFNPQILQAKVFAARRQQEEKDLMKKWAAKKNRDVVRSWGFRNLNFHRKSDPIQPPSVVFDWMAEIQNESEDEDVELLSDAKMMAAGWYDLYAPSQYKRLKTFKAKEDPTKVRHWILMVIIGSFLFGLLALFFR